MRKQKYIWIAVQDEYTCDYCLDMDGKEFFADELPDFPAHRGCRCMLTPIPDDDLVFSGQLLD